MDPLLPVVILLIAVALAFDYINGFHDAANSIATVVSTRVLSPGKAVIWAAFFNFVAAFGFGTAVAKTIGSGMIHIDQVTFAVIFAGLMGAIIWDLITWYLGLPTSSSHALIGGYAGAAITRAGFGGHHPGRVDEDAGLHRGLAADRPDRRAPVDGGDLLDVPACDAVAGGQVVPSPAAGLGGALQPEPRRERCAEDDGDHHGCALHGRAT